MQQNFYTQKSPNEDAAKIIVFYSNWLDIKTSEKCLQVCKFV